MAYKLPCEVQIGIMIVMMLEIIFSRLEQIGVLSFLYLNSILFTIQILSNKIFFKKKKTAKLFMKVFDNQESPYCN